MKNNTYKNNLSSFLSDIDSRKIINAAGTLTSLGGNRISADVIHSVGKISGSFIDMEKLSKDVGTYIAERIGVEAAYVTASGSAGIVLSIIAAINRFQWQKNSYSSKLWNGTYIAIQKMHKTEFQELVDFAGANIIKYGNDNLTTEESLINLLSEFKDKIAAVLHFVFDPMPGSLSLNKVIKIAHSFCIPVIVDAAAELPPKENLTKFVDMGADVVIFSGGKMIGSFSNSGIVVGKSEFINALSNIGPLHETDVNGEPKIYYGRPMKTSKEILIATVTALDEFLGLDEKKWMDNLQSMNSYIMNKVNDRSTLAIASITSPKWYHPRPAIIPRVEIKLNKNLSVGELTKSLKKNLIYVYADEDKLYINPQCLKKEDLPILVDNIIKSIDRIEKTKCD